MLMPSLLFTRKPRSSTQGGSGEKERTTESPSVVAVPRTIVPRALSVSPTSSPAVTPKPTVRFWMVSHVRPLLCGSFQFPESEPVTVTETPADERVSAPVTVSVMHTSVGFVEGAAIPVGQSESAVLVPGTSITRLPPTLIENPEVDLASLKNAVTCWTGPACTRISGSATSRLSVLDPKSGSCPSTVTGPSTHDDVVAVPAGGFVGWTSLQTICLNLTGRSTAAVMPTPCSIEAENEHGDVARGRVVPAQ